MTLKTTRNSHVVDYIFEYVDWTFFAVEFYKDRECNAILFYCASMFSSYVPFFVFWSRIPFRDVHSRHDHICMVLYVALHVCWKINFFEDKPVWTNTHFSSHCFLYTLEQFWQANSWHLRRCLLNKRFSLAHTNVELRKLYIKSTKTANNFPQRSHSSETFRSTKISIPRTLKEHSIYLGTVRLRF